MGRTVFVVLPDGSLTEAKLKLELAKEFGGSMEHRFYRTTCRMRVLVEGMAIDELVSIFTEIEGDPASEKFITFMANHRLSVERGQIVGLLHPNEWNTRRGEDLQNDLAALQEISEEYGIPMLPLSEERSRSIRSLGGT